MKFSVEKAILLNAVSSAGRAATTRGSVPAMEGVLLEAVGGVVCVTGYDLQKAISTSFEAAVQEQGSAVISAKLLADMIRKLPDDMLTLTAQDGQGANIVCGDVKYSVSCYAAKDFPEIPSVDRESGFEMPQNVLREMIRQTSFCVSLNEARPIQTGVLFDGHHGTLHTVALDGYRMAVRSERVETPLPDGGVYFVAPGNALDEVERICTGDGKISIACGKRHIIFQTETATLICRRLEGNFFDYKSVAPKKAGAVITVKPADLLQSLNRVSVVIDDKAKSPVRCEMRDGEIGLYVKTSKGTANDTCAAAGDGNGLIIGVNNRYLADALKNVPADKVRLMMETPVSPIMIVPEKENMGKFVYMVLPVRLKA